MALLLPVALTGIRHLPLAALKEDTSKQQANRCDKNNMTNICDKRCQDGAPISRRFNSCKITIDAPFFACSKRVRFLAFLALKMSALAARSHAKSL